MFFESTPLDYGVITIYQLIIIETSPLHVETVPPVKRTSPVVNIVRKLNLINFVVFVKLVFLWSE